MSAYTPSQIEMMARSFTTKQSEALSVVELSAKIDGEIFEAMLDQLADNMRLSEAGWDLFASVARLQFFGMDAPASERLRWRKLAGSSRDELNYAALEDASADAADHANDVAREDWFGVAKSILEPAQ